MLEKMATEREVDALADKVASGLQLDPGGQLLDMEELVYKASPKELEALRKQVLQKQALSGFDDEGLVKRFMNATKPKGTENGAGDNQSYFNCFQNQVMLPTVVDHCDQMPEDLHKNWLAVVCPQGTRVLVIASHSSTRVYDLEGTWICEHDTHLPGGSPNEISKAEEDECTILDCLYNDEQEIYHVVDLLCWKGLRFYKYETSVRMTTVAEKLKEISSLKRVSQTNPFRFYSLPVSSGCQKNAICNAIARASFEITGLLFYHKRALYLPGLSPLGVWVETSYIPAILDIQVHKLEYNSETSLTKRDWKKNRYEMSPEQCASIHNSAYVTNTQRNKPQRGGHSNYGPKGGQFHSFPNYPFNPPFPAFPNYNMGGPWGYEGYGGYDGYGDYGGYGGFNGNYHQQQQQQRHYPRPQQNYHQLPKESKKANEKQKEKVLQEKEKKISKRS